MTVEAAMGLEPLTPDDPSFVALLGAAGLLASDLDGPGKHFYRLRNSDGTLAAAGGLEILGDAGLLRSCVVAPAVRGAGFGVALIGALEHAAREAGVRSLYLLTETAEGFFGRLGYRVIDRSAVPPDVADLSQFAGVCPAGATAMAKRLG